MLKTTQLSEDAAKKLLNEQHGHGTLTISGAKDCNVLQQALLSGISLSSLTLKLAIKTTEALLEVGESIQDDLTALLKINELKLDLSDLVFDKDESKLRGFKWDENFMKALDYKCSLYAVAADIFSVLNLDCLNIKKLTISDGNLRLVNLEPLAELKNLSHLELTNCSIIYDNLQPFLTDLLKVDNLKLRVITLVKNPISYNVAKTLNNKKNLDQLLTSMTELSQRGLVFELENCLHYHTGFDLKDYEVGNSAWDFIQLLAQENKKKDLASGIEVAYTRFMEINEAYNALACKASEFSSNAYYQQLVSDTEKSLEKATNAFQQRAEENREQGNLEASYLLGQYKKMAGETPEDFIEAYEFYSEIPGGGPNFSKAQHAAIMLIGEQKVSPDYVIESNKIAIPNLKINESGEALRKLVALLFHSQKLAKLDIKHDKELPDINRVISYQLQEYISGNGMQPFFSDANEGGDTPLVGVNLNTVVTLVESLRQKNREVKALKTQGNMPERSNVAFFKEAPDKAKEQAKQKEILPLPRRSSSSW